MGKPAGAGGSDCLVAMVSLGFAGVAAAALAPRSRAPLYVPASEPPLLLVHSLPLAHRGETCAPPPLSRPKSTAPEDTKTLQQAPPPPRASLAPLAAAAHQRDSRPMPRVSIREPPSSSVTSRAPSASSAMERRRPVGAYARPATKGGRLVSQAESPRGELHGGESGSSEVLLQQNQSLRRRLDEESASYRRRLDTYKQAQQHQAALVSRLQAKVLQYKQRCSELEAQTDGLGDPGGGVRPLSSGPMSLDSAAYRASPSLPETERITDLESALRRLDEERRRAEKALHLNSRLREQLEESHSTNDALTADLQKLTADWETMRDEMIAKEEEWKEEEHTFNEYYTAEHNRLLSLWRDVVSMKRLFSEVRSNTERDLNRLRSDLTNSSQEMTSMCTGLASSMRSSTMVDEKQLQQQQQENTDLRAEIATLRAQFDATQADIRSKDERIQQLVREMQGLEERCGDAEHEASLVQRAQEELALLQGALRDIAHAVIQDAESRDDTSGQPASHIHLSPAGPPPPRSPKRGLLRGPTSPAFAESTISAVQAALHKHQLQVHELHVKLQSTREQLLLVRRQCEASDESGQSLEARVAELTAQLDSARALASQLGQEKDLLQKSLDATRNDKNALERNRQEVNSMVDTLNSDYDKVHKANARLQKLADGLEDEKLFLQGEQERLAREAEVREAALRAEEERCSRLREDLLTAREELSNMYLTRDLLEQQKLEAEGVISQVEKSKGEIEMELEQALMEKSDVQQALVKVESICNSLDQDKRRLQEDLRRLNDERNNLQSQCADQHNDLGSLRKELLQAEQTRLELESEKVSMQEKTKFIEMEKEKVEFELGQVSRERTELGSQLSALARQKEALNEELQRLRQRLEQASETNARINRDLEDLIKEKEEKQVMLEGTEKELQRVQEQQAALRSEKESLEAVLFDVQSSLETSEVRAAALEKEQQALLVTQEQLRGQCARLTRDLETSERRAREGKAAMQSQVASQEAEFQQTVANLKKNNEEATKKLTEEKEQVRVSLERRMQTSMQQLSVEKEAEAQQLLARIEELQAHMEALVQQHEESLLRAENDKQQALLLAHHDLQALQERLEGVRRELEEEQSALERLKREAATRSEQDRGTMNQLRDELSKFKAKLEETRLKGDEEKSRLEGRIIEARSERDTAQQECEELRVQLHLTEDRTENVQAQLQETARKLKELENANESVRKELNDNRRQLADSNCEKDKYGTSNKELREHVKRAEGEKREQARALEEAFQKISSLEDARTTLEAEKQRVLGQLREAERAALVSGQQVNSLMEEKQRLEASQAQRAQEQHELAARLATEAEEKERAQQEMHQLRKQMMELDNGLEVSRSELSRLRSRAAEEEERWRGREQALAMRLEDGRARERKLEDQKHNLEVCLADATQQIQELRAKLGGAEGRVRALDSQLASLESAKKETEQRLSSVGSTLRRIAGIQLDGSVSLPYRLSSPSRRWSPARGHHHHRSAAVSEDERSDRGEVIDLDPEAVRKGVRSLMQQVAQIERERDDYKTQVVAAQKQLGEAQETQGKGDARLGQVLQNIKVLQEEKCTLESKLAHKQAALNTQTEALQKKTEESLHLRERVTVLELSVQSGSEEKSQADDKVERLRQAVGRLDHEKRGLQDELSRTEARATKLELQRLSMEGDLQRLQMMMQEKDVHCQKVLDKSENQTRNLASLEERCASLKATIDQLNLALERASSGEGDLRAEIQELRRALLDQGSSAQCSTEKLKQLQKSLQNSENERRVLAERLEASQNAAAELRRTQSQIAEQSQRLQAELANSEVQRSGLETQLRLSSWPEGAPGGSAKDEEATRQLQVAQRDRLEMKAKADMLQDKVRQLERALERAKSSRGYDSSSALQSGESNAALAATEQELREIRLKVRRLETQLAEREAELARRPAGVLASAERSAELERLRSSLQHSERLLEAREQSHRQQVLRLENQIQLLREQLSQEVKRRQMYLLRSSKAGREMQQLRQALGDSLRSVAQDPSVDAALLEHEARKLDSATSLEEGRAASRARTVTPLPPPK